MSNPVLIEHKSFNALSDALTNELAQACHNGQQDRGRASMVLAGGGTPMPIYEQLAGHDLNWPDIDIIASDERWVASDHAASNHHQLVKRFGQSGARLLPLVPEHPGKQPGIEAAMQALVKVDGAFDACLLGMGGDGHFASLFPHATQLISALDTASRQAVITLLPDPLPADAPYARVSLTLPRLLNSNSLLLVITGSTKRQVLERAMRDDADANELPVAALIRAAGDRIQIHWSP